jgi:hypothetical protein
MGLPRPYSVVRWSSKGQRVARVGRIDRRIERPMKRRDTTQSEDFAKLKELSTTSKRCDRRPGGQTNVCGHIRDAHLMTRQNGKPASQEFFDRR